MNYAIDAHTEHPLADVTVVNAAQGLAEKLDFEGAHPFSVAVKRAGTVIAPWAEGEDS